MKKILKPNFRFYNMKLNTALLAVLAVCSIAQFAKAVNTQGFDASDLEIWRSPEFKKRFAESYIAETEIEPRLTVEERKKMLEILDMISSDEVEKATDTLIKNINDRASAVFDFTLANIYFQQAEYDQALEIYKTAVKKYPKFMRAWRNLGLIQVRQGSFNDAAESLTRVIELGGANSTTYGVLGFSYASLGNSLAAESAYRWAILLDPNTIDWKLGLAKSFFKQQRYNEAISLCDSLIEAYPDRADIWLLQANAYIGMNQALKAAEIYEIVDELGKSTSDSLNILADIYINEQLYDLGVNSYIKAMEKGDKKDAERAIRGARILVSSGQFAPMRRLLESIDEIYGKNLNQEIRKDILKLKARLAVAQGDGGEQARVLEEIIALDPLDGEAILLLGQHWESNGQTEKAVFYYERAANIENFEADANIRIAQVYVGKGKYEEAIALIRRAQQVNYRENVQKYLEQVERVAKSG